MDANKYPGKYFDALTHTNAILDRIRGSVYDTLCHAYDEGKRDTLAKRDAGVSDPGDRGADQGEGDTVSAEEWEGAWDAMRKGICTVDHAYDCSLRLRVDGFDPRRKEEKSE